MHCKRPELCKSSLHKSYIESIKLLAKMIIFKYRIFKISDINQGKYKHAIQKKKEFLVCLKKVIQRNEKKNPIFVYPRLRYADKKIKLCMQNFFWKIFV